MIARPFRQGDRVKSPEGWGEITGEYNNDPELVGYWLVELERTYWVERHAQGLSPRPGRFRPIYDKTRPMPEGSYAPFFITGAEWVDAPKEVPYPENQLRHETFAEFMFRPKGFGRTKWGQFAVMQLFFLLLVAAGIATWNDNGWTAVAFVGMVEAVIVLMTYRNYTSKTV